MNNLTGFLNELEKLAFKILLMVILLPKTIVKIILDPSWAPEYINGELQEQQKPPFGEYLSPIFIFVITTIIPLLLLPFVPNYGAKITGTLRDNRNLIVNAEVTFKPHSTNLRHEFWWAIWKYNGLYENSTFVKGESHYRNGILPLRFTESDGYFVEGEDSLDDSFLWLKEPVDIIDESNATDLFENDFSSLPPGDYSVNFFAAYFAKNSERPIEVQDNSISVFVPDSLNEPIRIGSSDPVVSGPVFSWDEFQKNLASSNTYYLAILFLALPLILALANKVFIMEIGEDTLRVTFYTQCYYFSPLSVAFWATTYASRFSTPDIFFRNENLYGYEGWLLQMPLWLISAWFVLVQTNSIAKERKMSKWKAFLVLILLTFMGLIGLIVYNALSDSLAKLRVSMIFLYPLASIIIFVTLILLNLKKWVAKIKDKKR
jgi:hypothetical protein